MFLRMVSALLLEGKKKERKWKRILGVKQKEKEIPRANNFRRFIKSNEGLCSLCMSTDSSSSQCDILITYAFS